MGVWHGEANTSPIIAPTLWVVRGREGFERGSSVRAENEGQARQTNDQEGLRPSHRRVEGRSERKDEKRRLSGCYYTCEWGRSSRPGCRDNKNSADSVSLMSVCLIVRGTLEGGEKPNI